ncbi:uncharacterized protein [Watersipora subatra]|uniref:uncharacterized protein n=1 Tax=Watersipora subatra TaxID=2589382 RepID=UPI00355B3686
MAIADIWRIVHYGAPSSLDEYVQEVGRGGRDGQECEAAIILHRHALSGSVDDESKAYVKKEDCRRHLILKTFDSNVPKPSPTVNCCGNCLKAPTSCCHDKAI